MAHNLRSQRRILMGMLNCGSKKVWINPDPKITGEIQKARNKDDLMKFILTGDIQKKEYLKTTKEQADIIYGRAKTPEQLQKEAEEKKLALEFKKSTFKRVTEAKQKALFTPLEPKIPDSTYRQMKKMKSTATQLGVLKSD